LELDTLEKERGFFITVWVKRMGENSLPTELVDFL